MSNNLKTTLSGIILVVIFGSGVVIWGFNKIQGKDLAQPPNFDLSAYDELTWPRPEEVFDLGSFLPEDETGTQLAEKFAGKVEDSMKSRDDFEPQPHTIYFSVHFKSDSATATRTAVDNFLSDFPEIKVVAVDDLSGNACYPYRLPVEARQELIAALTAEEAVSEVRVSPVGAPVFDICFTNERYYAYAKSFEADHQGVVLVAAAPLPAAYSVAVEYDAADETTVAVVERLKSEYGDVLTITD